ncbi:Glycosyl phosphatidyl inositol protein transamidase complex subunit [Polyrhizophydium stewartii]|uniref:Glycosyl phosphatidyl inositol protein transamidase complex subunit n=1 Tax=Polyrhizophydium stewartii TaxID=2732419 RepID=A0ABR4N7A5_9FUNG
MDPNMAAAAAAVAAAAAAAAAVAAAAAANTQAVQAAQPSLVAKELLAKAAAPDAPLRDVLDGLSAALASAPDLPELLPAVRQLRQRLLRRPSEHLPFVDPKQMLAAASTSAQVSEPLQKTLWIVSYIVSSLPHSALLPLHLSLINVFRVSGNAPLTDLVNQQNTVSPLAAFLGEMFTMIAEDWPEMLGSTMRLLLRLYETDIFDPQTHIDQTKESRFIVSYITSMAIVCPALWRVCRAHVLPVLTYASLTDWAIIESSANVSLFADARSPQTLLPMSSHFVQLATIVFQQTISEPLHTLRLLVELSNWCTFIERLQVTAQQNFELTDKLKGLAAQLQTLFSRWYLLAQDAWIMPVLDASLNAKAASAATDLLQASLSPSATARLAFRSSECHTILAMLDEDTASTDRSRHILIVEFVGMQLGNEQLALLLCQAGLQWALDDRIAYFLAQTSEDLPKYLLSAALSIQLQHHENKAGLSDAAARLIKELGNRLRGFDGILVVRRILENLGTLELLKSRNAKPLSSEHAAGAQSASKLHLGLEMQRMAVGLEQKRPASPVEAFRLGLAAHDSLDAVAAMRDAADAARDAADDTDLGLLQDAHAAQLVRLFHAYRLVPALFQRTLRARINATPQPRSVDAPTGLNTKDLRLRASETAAGRMLAQCILHTESPHHLVHILRAEIMHTKQDLLWVLLQHPWLWHPTVCLAEACQPPEADDEWLRLLKIGQDVLRLLDRWWRLRGASSASEWPPQLDCTQRLIEFLAQLCNVLLNTAPLLWSSIWLAPHLSGEQMRVLLSIWADISDMENLVRNGPKSRHEEAVLIRDARRAEWNLHAAGLWKAAAMSTDDDILGDLAPLAQEAPSRAGFASADFAHTIMASSKPLSREASRVALRRRLARLLGGASSRLGPALFALGVVLLLVLPLPLQELLVMPMHELVPRPLHSVAAAFVDLGEPLYRIMPELRGPFTSLHHQAATDEKALLVGQVNRYFGYGDMDNSFHVGLGPVLWGDGMTTLNQSELLATEFDALGFDVSVQDFTFLKEDEYITGHNVHGILRAPRGDGTEAMVLAAPMTMHDGEPNANGIRYLLGLAKFLRRYSFWSKDIIFVVTTHQSYGVHSWLEAYHGFEPTHRYLLDFGPLSSHAGSLVAALCLEFPGTEDYTRLGIYPAGVNGLLPNADLVVTVIQSAQLAQPERLPLELFDTIMPHATTFWQKYIVCLRRLWTFVKIQASGLPQASHALFLKYKVEAMTLRGLIIPGSTRPVGMQQVASLIETSLRSLNNLLEKLHHSYWFYFMPSPEHFMPISVYIAPIAILAASVILASVGQWLESPTADPKADTTIDRNSKWPYVRRIAGTSSFTDFVRPLVLPLVTLGSAVILGIWLLSNAQMLAFFAERNLNAFIYMEAGVIGLHVMFSHSVMPFLHRLFYGSGASTQVSVPAWKILRLGCCAALGMILFVLTAINPSLAILIALPYVPLMLLIRPTENPALRHAQTVLLNALSPPGVLILIVIASGGSLQVLRDVKDMIRDWRVFGSQLMPIIGVLIWPLSLAAQTLVQMEL